MVHYKLTYFPIRGAGEVIRQIFAVAGVNYEDDRLPLEQWPQLKGATPFEQLPVLEVDGKQLAQSHAIARYLANEFGLNGSIGWEQAQVNALADQIKDYQNEIRPFIVVAMGFAEGDLDQLRNDVFIPALEKNLTFFEKILTESQSGFLVGNSLTWIDLLLAQHTEDTLRRDLAAIEKFKHVLAHRKQVQGLDAVRRWLETRPETPF